jgi:excisionase family DNA binding protein
LQVEKQLLSVREFATAIGVGESLAKKLVREGTVLSVRIGDRRLIPSQAVRTDVERLVAEAQADALGAL